MKRWSVGVRLATMALMAMITVPAPAAGVGRDLHDYWDGRCKDCHGDAGPFARRTLRVEQGRLVGTHHGANSSCATTISRMSWWRR